MNTYRLKLKRHYRFGYQQNGIGYIHSTSSRYCDSKESIEYHHEKLKQLRRDHPDYTFWIEELHQDTAIWHKLKENSMYALFSEDEEEEEKPIKKKPAPATYDGPWVFIPDRTIDDIPF